MKKPDACGRTFILTNRHKLHNTARVKGARSSVLDEGSYGRRVFSGFVFRGDSRAPERIFSDGFEPLPQYRFNPANDTEEEFMAEITGEKRGYTQKFGISTALSARIAGYYTHLSYDRGRDFEYFVSRTVSQQRSNVSRLSFWFQWTFEVGPLFSSPHPFTGYIYLIDARLMSGYAIKVPPWRRDTRLVNLGLDAHLLQEIYEVNFMHAIPATAIVGVLWSHKQATVKQCMDSLNWIYHRDLELTLGENPEYDGDAASVAKLFE